MLLARLFQSLEHPQDSYEVPSERAFRRSKSLLLRDVSGHVAAPRSQRGGVVGGGRRLGSLMSVSGIIPVTGGFIP
ncbi:MAG: hypothetical protein GXC75_01740 [Xanthomonadaceae bacterium]|nr:hypothetical protein [Xanthomonadaceae bacterium]